MIADEKCGGAKRKSLYKVMIDVLLKSSPWAW